MRESLRDIDRLQHIKERIDNVMSFLEGRTFEDMKSNVMCYHAVVDGKFTLQRNKLI